MTMLNGVVVGTNPRNLSSGQEASPTLNKRGELIAGWPWHLQLAHEGKVFVCGAGTETTPVTATSTTTLDSTLPDLYLRIPSGTLVIPLFIQVYYEATGGTIAEGIALVSDSDPGNGTSSAADRTPKNLRARGASSACTARQLVTVTPTFTNAREFWRFGEPADLDGTVTGESGFSWDYRRNAGVPMIVGPGTIHVATGCGTSSTLFITLVYAEFQTSELN